MIWMYNTVSMDVHGDIRSISWSFRCDIASIKLWAAVYLQHRVFMSRLVTEVMESWRCLELAWWNMWEHGSWICVNSGVAMDPHKTSKNGSMFGIAKIIYVKIHIHQTISILGIFGLGCSKMTLLPSPSEVKTDDFSPLFPENWFLAVFAALSFEKLSFEVI